MSLAILSDSRSFHKPYCLRDGLKELIGVKSEERKDSEVSSGLLLRTTLIHGEDFAILELWRVVVLRDLLTKIGLARLGLAFNLE